jgi:hypothetical protein
MKLYFAVLLFVSIPLSISASAAEPPASPASDASSEDDLSLLAELAAVAPESSGRCSVSDVAVWRGNSAFTDIHRSCARSKFGNGEKTAACILKRFPSLSHSCATCFGGVTECMRTECWAKCFLDDTSDDCMLCFDRKCQGGFQHCIGTELLAVDASNVPLRPGEIVHDGIVTRTTTTGRPSVTPRTRPSKSTSNPSP